MTQYCRERRRSPPKEIPLNVQQIVNALIVFEFEEASDRTRSVRFATRA
jgi:hypothetical protein